MHLFFFLCQIIHLTSDRYIFGYIPKERFLDPPPPINFVHESYMLDMDIIDHVAAALGPESVLTQPNPKIY